MVLGIWVAGLSSGFRVTAAVRAYVRVALGAAAAAAAGTMLRAEEICRVVILSLDAQNSDLDIFELLGECQLNQVWVWDDA